VTSGSGRDTRTRILEAAVVCIERSGLAKTSLEDVASEAGVSRATLYRWFAGGREQLIRDTVVWEIGQFLGRLAEALDAEPDLEHKLIRGLVYGHHAIGEHLLLQRMLSTEPELFLTELQSALPILNELVLVYVRELLGQVRLRPGVEIDQAADYVSGLFLSYLGSQGSWDLTDEAAVGRLVRAQLLAGVVLADERVAEG
jgi:AcrR family transcriptional regulator